MHFFCTYLSKPEVCLKCCTFIAHLKRFKDCTPSILHWALHILSDFEAYLKCCTSSTVLNRFYPVSIFWHLWRSPEEVWSAKCKCSGQWVQNKCALGKCNRRWKEACYKHSTSIALAGDLGRHKWAFMHHCLSDIRCRLEQKYQISVIIGYRLKFIQYATPAVCLFCLSFLSIWTLPRPVHSTGLLFSPNVFVS